MEDEKIVELFFSRDERAVAAVREKFGGLLYSTAMRLLRSHTDAEECVNDALLAIWSSIPPARPDDLKPYVCKVVRNLSLKRLSYNLADKRSQNAAVPLSELEAVLPDASAREALDKVDLSIVLDGFLSTLNLETRVIFTRRYFFFDSVGDIASDIGISESKVKSSLMRTRNKFKKYLNMKGNAI